MGWEGPATPFTAAAVSLARAAKKAGLGKHSESCSPPAATRMKPGQPSPASRLAATPQADSLKLSAWGGVSPCGSELSGDAAAAGLNVVERSVAGRLLQAYAAGDARNLLQCIECTEQAVMGAGAARNCTHS